MNNRLAENPPAEIVREIMLENLSGALRLVHGRVKSVIYFNAGEIVYAGSNMRALCLSQCVRRWEIVPADKLSFIEARESLSDKDFGALLVSENVCDREGLARLMVRQAAEAFRHALNFDAEGQWTFGAGARLAADAWTRFDADEFLMERARRASVDLILARLGNDDEIISPTNRSLSSDLLPTEGFILSRVDSPLRLGDVVALSGLKEAEAKRIVYALALGGYVRRENSPRAALAACASEANAAHSAPAAITATNNTRMPDDDEKTSTEASKDEPRDDGAEIEELFRLAGGATHYEVLGVGRNVKPDALKRAYYALAKRFHPDRFHKDASDESRPRIESAFARIAQAYEALSEPATRATYDLKLSRMGQSPVSPAAPSSKTEETTNVNRTPPPSSAFSSYVQAAQQASPAAPQESAAGRAAESFRLGTQALEQGNDLLATARCGEAARLAPREARYRAHYGRALARNPKTRRLAETEFLAAIALDERNSAYRVMLAELYRDIGLKRRAEGELQRALAVDPQHAAARRLLNELRAA